MASVSIAKKAAKKHLDELVARLNTAKSDLGTLERNCRNAPPELKASSQEKVTRMSNHIKQLKDQAKAAKTAWKNTP